MPTNEIEATANPAGNEAWRHRKCPHCGLTNFEFVAAIAPFVVIKERDPFGDSYLIDSSFDVAKCKCLRAAFLHGRRYLSADWTLGVMPPSIAFVFVDEDVDEPLGLDGVFTVKGFDEQVFDESTLTPLQRQRLVRQPPFSTKIDGKEIVLQVKSVQAPDWSMVCTPATTKADIAAAASIEYAVMFDDSPDWKPDISRSHRRIEEIAIDISTRTIELLMGS